MTTVINILVLLHLLGMAALVGGYATTFTNPRPIPAMLWGARAQLLTGLVLYWVMNSEGYDVSHVFVAIKLVIAVIVTGLLEAANGMAARDEPKPVLVQIAGVLAIVNVGVAALWQ